MQDVDLQALRHTLHQYPELAHREYATARRIREFIDSNCPADQVFELAETGLAFVYHGAAQGPGILIRAELDALPLREVNEDLPYKSVHPGVSHKCGHDGHMTIAAGVAQHVYYNRPEAGRVIILFQPAEETGEGGPKMVSDPAFAKLAPDYVFALHNVPGYPMHQILCRTGSFTPAVTSQIIKLHGREVHAATPGAGINPGSAVAEIIQAAEQINSKAREGSFMTLIHINLGEKAYGVSAGYAELHYTLRGIGNNDLHVIQDSLQQAAKNSAMRHNLDITYDETETFKANINDEIAVEMIREAVGRNNLSYHECEKPMPWGEDFGHISSYYNGAMFGLGSGTDSPALHKPDYDFPDALIATGVAIFTNLIDKVVTGDTSGPQSAASA